MVGKLYILKTVVLLLVADLIFIAIEVINKSYSDEIIMVIIVATIRFICLRIVFKGSRAASLRRQLQADMKEADRKYDEELKTRMKYCENEDSEHEMKE